ncbi:MAG TPA: hypothetical protein PKX13_02865 [Acidiphilium sp.]|nr:hypothetical protein [Acidiphilium sp.]
MAQPVKRVEDVRLIKGHGTYTDDVNQPGALHVLILRSPHTNAEIIAIDTKAAASLPGVVAIYPAADRTRTRWGPADHVFVR